MKEFIQVEMLAKGAVSGQFSEWPLLKAEARHLLDEYQRIAAELFAEKLSHAITMKQRNSGYNTPKRRRYPRDKKQLLFVADGPESIELYTSEDLAIVDMCPDVPALYLVATLHDSAVRLGPFTLRSIREGVERALGGRNDNPINGGVGDPGEPDPQGQGGGGPEESAGAGEAGPAGKKTEGAE